MRRAKSGSLPLFAPRDEVRAVASNEHPPVARALEHVIEDLRAAIKRIPLGRTDLSPVVRAATTLLVTMHEIEYSEALVAAIRPVVEAMITACDVCLKTRVEHREIRRFAFSSEEYGAVRASVAKREAR